MSGSTSPAERDAAPPGRQAAPPEPPAAPCRRDPAPSGREAAPRLLYLCLEALLPGGAACTHVGEICEGLRRRGWRVTLAGREARVREGGTARLRRYAAVFAAALAALPGCDAVYVRSHFAAWPVAVLAWLLGRPTIHEINGTHGDALVTHPGWRRVARLFAAAQSWQYRRAALLIAVTPGLADWARAEAGHDRVAVIGNAANTDRFRPEGPRVARPRPYLLFFGGLTRWHGVPAMLEAAGRPDWPAATDLLIAGPVVDASLGPELDRAPDHVVRLGPLPQADLPGLIRGAVATLVPISDPAGRSSHGVLPLKLFEGLACGVPAVVTDLAGQAPLVRQGGCGLVVPVDDPAALAGAASLLVADPARASRMGEAGARLVREHHSWDAAAARTAELLDGVRRRA